MGEVIGQLTNGVYSTWAQLRCPLIGGYDQWEKHVGPGPSFHNLVIDSGFHPDDGLFVRVAGWPDRFSWLDINSNPHEESNGPIVGFNNGFGTSPSYISVGAYDATFNETTNPIYTSVNNNLDLKDITDSLVGLTVTYSGGTFTTTSDAFKSDPASPPWFGQDIGLNAITSVTSISTFTAF
jgi:hypothetical protein